MRKKEFTILKSTPRCQRLVAEWTNMECDTKELELERSFIFKIIKAYVMPEALDLLREVYSIESITAEKLSKYDDFIED